MIQFEDVRKSYGDLTVLNGVNLIIPKGEKVALMGFSGCGKTTLLRCINGLEHIGSGKLVVNGEDVQSPALNWNRFRSRIGMVFQQFNLFPHLTVLENVMLGPVKVKQESREQAAERAYQLLKQVDISAKAAMYPDQLSGGQKQRVAIARSLAMQPDILLLDEPTSALDPPMSREVLAVIEQVAAQGMTLVMVTHELRFVSHMADRLVFVDGGQVVEQGSPRAIMNHPVQPATQRYLELFEG
ncbi:amino acid ABC transporter ATP-binding protein [Vampirovibrio sp.]|uniref:amino acid ABC transporter ATP-binding protein n=1 Tax=Vampirovibrio sp. TaxID=2717857 RepID=UPI0035938D00